MERPIPTDQRVFLTDDDLIVSKTDTKGFMTYVNTTFIRIAGYSYEELMGKPHSLIRHPDMPRTIFRVLWEVISTGNEQFAYVKNMTKTGGYYWVFAHVTPTFDLDGKIIGYHSNRRNPSENAIQIISDVYQELNNIENQYQQKELAIQAGLEFVEKALNGRSPNEFFLSL
ncbi:MAG: hypothetical protein CNLJKLNK_01216 [Holosporales bacterium]